MRVRERVGELERERERVRQRTSLLTNYVELCLVFCKADDCSWVCGGSAWCHSKSYEHNSSCRPCLQSQPDKVHPQMVKKVVDAYELLTSAHANFKAGPIAVQDVCEEGPQGPALERLWTRSLWLIPTR